MLSGHARDEKDYWYEIVQIETLDGDTVEVETALLRVYPSGFDGYDAYMDIKSPRYDPYRFKKVYFPTLKTEWEVISGPHKSPIAGYFRGNYIPYNPQDNPQGCTPAWMFGLRNCSN